MVGVLQYLAVVVILLWAFWRIFNKAGQSPWWAYLMMLPIAGLFTPIQIGLGLLIGVPIVMIWAFAFAPWPSIDNPPERADAPGYDPPAPERFKGRFRRTTRPSEQGDRARRGIIRRRPPDRGGEDRR